jgi:hypothetical protein
MSYQQKARVVEFDSDDFLGKALTLWKSNGDKHGEARAQHTLGAIAFKRGETRLAQVTLLDISDGPRQQYV